MVKPRFFIAFTCWLLVLTFVLLPLFRAKKTSAQDLSNTLSGNNIFSGGLTNSAEINSCQLFELTEYDPLESVDEPEGAEEPEGLFTASEQAAIAATLTQDLSTRQRVQGALDKGWDSFKTWVHNLFTTQAASPAINPDDYDYIKIDQERIYTALKYSPQLTNSKRNAMSEYLADHNFYSAYTIRAKIGILARTMGLSESSLPEDVDAFNVLPIPNPTQNKDFMIVYKAELGVMPGTNTLAKPWPAIKGNGTFPGVTNQIQSLMRFYFPGTTDRTHSSKYIASVPYQLELIRGLAIYQRLNQHDPAYPQYPGMKLWMTKQNWQPDELAWLYDYWVSPNLRAERRSPYWRANDPKGLFLPDGKGTVTRSSNEAFQFFDRLARLEAGEAVAGKELGITFDLLTNIVAIEKIVFQGAKWLFKVPWAKAAPKITGTLISAREVPILREGIGGLEYGYRRFGAPVAKSVYNGCLKAGEVFRDTKLTFSAAVQEAAITKMKEGLEMLSKVPIFKGAIRHEITDQIVSRTHVVELGPNSFGFCKPTPRGGVEEIRLNSSMLEADPTGRRMQRTFIHESLHAYSAIKLGNTPPGMDRFYTHFIEGLTDFFTEYTYKTLNKVSPCPMIYLEEVGAIEQFIKAIARGLAKKGVPNSEERALEIVRDIYFKNGINSHEISKLLGPLPPGYRGGRGINVEFDSFYYLLESMANKNFPETVEYLSKLNR